MSQRISRKEQGEWEIQRLDGTQTKIYVLREKEECGKARSTLVVSARLVDGHDHGLDRRNTRWKDEATIIAVHHCHHAQLRVEITSFVQ